MRAGGSAGRMRAERGDFSGRHQADGAGGVVVGRVGHEPLAAGVACDRDERALALVGVWVQGWRDSNLSAEHRNGQSGRERRRSGSSVSSCRRVLGHFLTALILVYISASVNVFRVYPRLCEGS